MKLNLIEINKLTPHGLWDLGVLTSVIAMLRGVMAVGAGSAALVYGRMLLQYSESLRERTRDNLNMRIKTWVLLCPARVAHVRHIIGEAAIRRWRKNRLADYALTKYFGDWKRKWPEGFGGEFTNNDTEPRRNCAPKFTCKTRVYKWKLFALVKIVNVHRFLYRKLASNAEEQEIRVAYYKLWGVDVSANRRLAKWTQPRAPRTLKPIRFTPDELDVEAEEAAETSPSLVIAQDAPKRIEGEVQSGTKTNDPPSDKKPP